MPFGLPYDSGEMAEVLRQRGSLEAQIGQTQASVSDCDPGWLSLFITYSEWAGMELTDLTLGLRWLEMSGVWCDSHYGAKGITNCVSWCSPDERCHHDTERSVQKVKSWFIWLKKLPSAFCKPKTQDSPSAVKDPKSRKSRVLSREKVDFLVQEECKPSCTVFLFCFDKNAMTLRQSKEESLFWFVEDEFLVCGQRHGRNRKLRDYIFHSKQEVECKL